MAQVLNITVEALRRWLLRRHRSGDKPAAKLGRPTTVGQRARREIRECYLKHYKLWGPKVLAHWARRQGLGSWCASTIAEVIADLVEAEKGRKPKPIRYELTAAMVMWSEDGTAFKERGRKKELVVAQDEHARFKVKHRLVDGPAGEGDVISYLSRAFDRYGPPLVLKHDGDKIFNSNKVAELLKHYGVVSLTNPPYYPQYNGKMERSMRDIKQHVRAQRKYGVREELDDHIDTAMLDLNEQRPRPVLKGRTAREVFDRDRIPLPDRWAFMEKVRQTENHYMIKASSRRQKQSARRKAVETVLLNYGLLEIIGSVSTELKTGSVT